MPDNKQFWEWLKENYGDAYQIYYREALRREGGEPGSRTAIPPEIQSIYEYWQTNIVSQEGVEPTGVTQEDEFMVLVDDFLRGEVDAGRMSEQAYQVQLDEAFTEVDERGFSQDLAIYKRIQKSKESEFGQKALQDIERYQYRPEELERRREWQEITPTAERLQYRPQELERRRKEQFLEKSPKEQEYGVRTGAMPQGEAFTDTSGKKLTTSPLWGEGTPWEKWQHGEAEISDKQRQFSERQNVEKTIQSIQQRGYDSPEEYYTAIMGAYQDAHDIVSSGTYQQELAQRRYSIGLQLQDYKLTKAGQAGQAMAFDYKPWYEKFLETPEYKALAFETYLTPTETGGVFRNWALAKPEFKADVIKQETQKLQDFPTLHPWYKETRKPTQTFQTWLGETPPAQAFYLERRKELEKPRARAIPKWA